MNQDLVLDSSLQSAKNLAWWLYLGHAASLVFSLGAFSFIPLIINYVKREDAANTFVYSHHSWQIRSFWWYLVWMAVGGLLFMTIIGIPAAFLLWTVAWIWKLYRLIKGIVDLNDNKPMP
ncbi:hypothetical protein DBR37_13870 [Herminiimonas sp. KBW02]|uniref:DUF4870 family protein n=1 Tax=Herminiimonas sp. KBW02 TaxID=2153363 RepID=UPI000F59FD20|nr:DUF4870 domain-containing protein [Herminiimonas sp. KBW02]RQO33295.1 hypothetical protein DBR37_13870 [Herminiimonas sp. KBW02]